MKRLSDYKGEEAIDLWADIIESVSEIIKDPELQNIANNVSVIDAAKYILKTHKKETCDVLLRIDDTPINGLNVLIRTVSVLSEIGEIPELADFFGMQGQNEVSESSGSAMENTEAEEH